MRIGIILVLLFAVICQINSKRIYNSRELVDALNHAVNKAAEKLRTKLKNNQGDYAYLKDTSIFLPYIDDRDGVTIDLMNGQLTGLSSVQGANRNFIFPGEKGLLAMTVNIKFNKLVFAYDYLSTRPLDFQPNAGFLKFIAFNVPIKGQLLLELDQNFDIPTVRFSDLWLDYSDSGTVKLHFNGREQSETGLLDNELIELYGRFASERAQKLIKEYAKFLRHEIKRHLEYNYHLIEALQKYNNQRRYKPDLNQAINFAVNFAAQQVSAQIQRENAGYRYIYGEKSLFMPYANPNGYQTKFRLKNGDVSGLATIQGANGNYLFVTQDGQLAITVNLQFNRLAFQYDYDVQNNINRGKEFGVLDVVAYNVPFLGLLLVDVQYQNGFPKVIFRNLLLKGIKKIGKIQFFVNGREYLNKGAGRAQFENYIRTFAKGIVFEFSEYLIKAMDWRLGNNVLFRNTVQYYYMPHK